MLKNLDEKRAEYIETLVKLPATQYQGTRDKKKLANMPFSDLSEILADELVKLMNA